jgi:DNA repair exonuclease SbcCD ATPase subunit
MIFKNIRFQNLLSTGNQWTEIDLNKNDKTLIVGGNGAGKSTVLDAISFVLYNKPFREKLNKPQLVNKITKKNCLVEVEFLVGSNEYLVRRGIKPDIFEVYKNNKLIDQSADNRDYQKDFEKYILKCSHRSFTQIVILGTANWIPFMKLPTPARRGVVEDLLDQNIFTHMNVVLKNRKDANELSIKDVQKDIEILTTKIDMIEKHNQELSFNAQKVLSEKKEKIADAYIRIEGLEEFIVSAESTIQKLEDSIKDNTKVIAAKEKISNIKEKVNDRILTLKKEQQFFLDNEECPTCSQTIQEDHKKAIVDKNFELIETLVEKQRELHKKFVRVSVRITEIEKVNKEISDIKIRKSKDEATKMSNLDYVKELTNEIDVLKKEEEKKEKTDSSELQEKRTVQEAYFKSLIHQRQIYENLTPMLKDTGVKARIIKKHIPIINKLLNKYLSMMDFFCQFTIDENFDEKILSRYREDFSYGNFSQGEKFRINLAFLFTWRAIAQMRNSVNTNILFLDEVFESSLDPDGLEDFYKILTIINEKEAPNIFVISPKGDTLFDRFEHTIEFQKIKNFSQMKNRKV